MALGEAPDETKAVEAAASPRVEGEESNGVD